MGAGRYLSSRHPSASWKRPSTAEWLVIQVAFDLQVDNIKIKMDPSLRWDDGKDGLPIAQILNSNSFASNHCPQTHFPQRSKPLPHLA
ncbi:MAG TPA: hypothetical protein VET30_00805 [Pseudoxanthomonas sp.]|nr:hypothetical protein [Pseudoxanthomonas sp.]